MSRVAAAAIEAALDEEKDDKPRRGRLTGVKALATGAALVVAAQAAAKLAPVHRLADLASVPERLRERVQERGWFGDDDEPDSRNGQYEEPVDEEDEDFDPEDEEDEDFDPEDEEDEDDDDEDDEPEDEEDEDYDDEDDEEEPHAEADDEEAGDEEPEEPAEPTGNGAPADAPDALVLLSTERRRPRFMSRAKARVDPAARPPEPPESDSDPDDS